jgi:L-threonylcarbamoyladenylate synthase
MNFLRKFIKFAKQICQIQDFVVSLHVILREMRYDKDDIQEALRVLRAGGIILYPTDTVWGIGCDATNAEAVARIYALKKREDSKSMLVLLDSPAKLDYYVEVPEAAEMLLESQNDQTGNVKPLTLIYPNARHLAPNLIAEDGSIGIRITNEPFSQALCAQLRHPIVSTSANISGEPTPKVFCEITEKIKEGVDYCCMFRREDENEHEPSSIIKINADGTFKIIRQ